MHPETSGFCFLQVLFISAILSIGILFFIIGKKFVLLVYHLIRAYQQKTVEVDIPKEVSELRKAIIQISKEREEIQCLLDPIRSKLSNLTNSIDFNLDSMYCNLQTSLEQESQRNDQRFSSLQTRIDAFKEVFSVAKEAMEKHEKIMERLPKLPDIEAWTQTEKEMLRNKPDKGHATGEPNQPRSIFCVIRKALQEFLKEAKEQMTLQRNQVVLDLETILTQLSVNNDFLKNTIEDAFAMAGEHTQASFMQIANVGREAMKCIAALSDGTDGTLTTKFGEVNDKLKTILTSMESLDFDVACIKDTLDNVDGQFDEIYKKLELGCEKNVEYAEGVNNSLQATAQEWNEKSSQLDEVCKQLACATDGIKNMLENLKKAIGTKPPGTVDTNLEAGRQGIDNLMTAVQNCQVKLDTLADQINQNSYGVNEASGQLLNELELLTDLVRKSMESLKNVTAILPETESQLDKTLNPEGFARDGYIALDTISECTEDSQYDKEMKKKLKEIPKLIGTIDAGLNKAKLANCLKTSEFFKNTETLEDKMRKTFK